MPRLDSPYGGSYPIERARLLATRPHCALRLRCNGAPATQADHVPPLSQHTHVPGSSCCRLQPACAACQRAQARWLDRHRKRYPPNWSRRWL